MVSDYCVRWINGCGRTSAAVGDCWFFCHAGVSEGFWGSSGIRTVESRCMCFAHRNAIAPKRLVGDVGACRADVKDMQLLIYLEVRKPKVDV